jgi:hypothetical protein
LADWEQEERPVLEEVEGEGEEDELIPADISLSMFSSRK